MDQPSPEKSISPLSSCILSTFHEWVPVCRFLLQQRYRVLFQIFSHIRGSINSVRSSSNWQQQQHSQAIVKPLPQKRSLHRDGLTTQPQSPVFHENYLEDLLDKNWAQAWENRRFACDIKYNVSQWHLCLFSCRFICHICGCITQATGAAYP